MEKTKSMKRRNLFMSLTLMCSFFVIAFKFGTDGFQWFWTGMETAPILLGISAIILGTLWFWESKKNGKKI